MKRRDFVGMLGVVGSSVISRIAHAKPTKKNNSDVYTIGVNVPLTGFFAEESQNYIMGSQLAVDLVNSGQYGALKKYMPYLTQAKLLGKKVKMKYKNNHGSGFLTSENAKEMIDSENIVMITGGSSSVESIANRKVALLNNVTCMDGINHSTDCSENFISGFSVFFDNRVSAKLLTDRLSAELGQSDVKVMHVYSNYSWSNNQMRSMKSELNSKFNVLTHDHVEFARDQAIEEIAEKIENSNADILVINLYGGLLKDFVNKFARQQTNSNRVNIVPLVTHAHRNQINFSQLGRVYYSHFGAKAGSQEAEVLEEFARMFRNHYGKDPMDAAAVAFMQVLLYVNAANAARSVDRGSVMAFMVRAAKAPFVYNSSNQRVEGFAEVKVIS